MLKEEKTTWFRIKDLSPFLDGLYVSGIESCHQEIDFLEVKRLAYKDRFFVDTNRQFTFPGESLLINSIHLVKESPQIKFFDTKNPFGTLEIQGENEFGFLRVLWFKFTNCLQVTILELGESVKTIYSDNFFEKEEFIAAQDLLKHLKEENMHDLPMSLRNIKQSKGK